MSDLEFVRVDDPSDPLLADYLGLTDPADRARRERDEYFMVEGVVAIARLLESDHRVRSVLLQDTKVPRFAPALAGLDAPVLVTSREVMAETVGFKLHRGAMASAERRPLPSLAEVTASARTLAILEGLNDPENLGAVARSARALGVDALVLDPTCIDPYYRRIVRVSMGEILLLPVARASTWPDDLDAIAAAGFETWAMTPADGSVALWDIEMPDRLAIVLGAEGPGLQAATIERCHRSVRIPISTEVDSLNVGAAAAVTFAERARREPRDHAAT